MPRTDRPATGRTTYHRDGTVTLWDCLRSEWSRGAPSDSVLATLGADERAKVTRHCGADDAAEAEIAACVTTKRAAQ